MGNKTYAMIKPDAIRNGYMGKILDHTINAGFKILGAKLIRLTKAQAEGFYEIHKEKPFFNELIEYMTSAPVVVQVLDGENAVNLYRELMGSTNPKDAKVGTIRNEFAIDIQENSVHGSDSDENAKIEIDYFFNNEEIVG